MFPIFRRIYDTKSTDLPRNIYRVDLDGIPEDAPEVFRACNGYATSEGTLRFLTDKEYSAAHYCVLLNSALFDEYERYDYL